MADTIIGRPHASRRLPPAPYTRARLLVLTGDGFGEQLVLDPDRPVVIGSDPQCDLLLGDARVSRRHALVQCEAGWYVIRDLGSLYGVHVNNRRRTARRLRHNDLIELGDTRLLFVAG